MDMDTDLETSRCIDPKNMERQTPRKRKRKSRKGKENLGEDIELCGFGENKQTAREILEVKEAKISNSGLQDTLLDVGLTVQSPVQKHLMDATTNLEESREKKKKKKKKKKKRKPKKGKVNLSENMEVCGVGGQKQTVSESLDVKEMEISNSGLQDTLLDMDLVVQSPIQKHLLDTTTNLEECKETNERKKPREAEGSLGENKELCGFGEQKQTVCEISEVKEMEISTNGQQDTNLDVALTLQPPIQEHLMDTTTNLEECKKKKKQKRKKLVKGKENLGENKELCGFGEQKQTLSEILDVKEMDISNNGLQDTLLVQDLTVQSPMQKHLVDTTTNLEESKNKKKKKNRRKKPKTQSGESLQSLDHTEVVSASSLSDNSRHCVKSGNMNNVLNVSHLPLERTPVRRLKRKLLILDVNGLLADVVYPAPNKPKADAYIFARAVFMRPFCAEFLGFCFKRFDVGIWSSRSKNVLHRIVDYILGDRKHKLLFLWDSSRCTKTEFKTLESEDKFVVFKDLRKIWEKSDPNAPWEKGDYSESNTLLLDDSPYKALLNPAHTGIFPLPYSFRNRRDRSLGRVGNLRLYLDRLAKADNWKEYVKSRPFGQRAINKKSSQWDFYSNIIRSQSNLQLLV